MSAVLHIVRGEPAYVKVHGRVIVSDDPQRVARFVCHKLKVPLFPCTALGLVQDDTLIAGVLYCEYTVHNVLMHVAAEPGARWMTRRYLHAAFHYPFEHLKVDRVTGIVEASNKQALEFDYHLGFELEFKLEGAAKDGGDLLGLRMWKKDCRYIGDRYALR